MNTSTKLISGVGFTPGSAQDQREGLVGFVVCTIADVLLLDGIALRRTTRGQYTLSFPCRTDRNGKRHPYYQPLGARARHMLEDAIFDALGIEAEAQR